jgi:Na+-transporting methylmalonyl-CoA/oxaloacetate decarboxylase gamma subunit
MVSYVVSVVFLLVLAVYLWILWVMTSFVRRYVEDESLLPCGEKDPSLEVFTQEHSRVTVPCQG